MTDSEMFYRFIACVYVIGVVVVFLVGASLYDNGKIRIADNEGDACYAPSLAKGYEDRTSGARMMLGAPLWPLWLVAIATQTVTRLVRAIPVVWSDAKGPR